MMVMQTTKLANTAIPIPMRHHSTPFFEFPHKKRKQRRMLEEEQRQKALFEAEEESRSRAWDYIVDFLQASEWSDQMDQITVVYDAVPTMEELVSFGALDEKEGTRASRKLFKAPVVWDELGHGLWKVLSASEQKRQQQQQQQQQLQQQQQSQQLQAQLQKSPQKHHHHHHHRHHSHSHSHSHHQAPIIEEPTKPVCWRSSSFGGYVEFPHSICNSRRSSSRRTSEDSCATAISQDCMSLSSSPSRHGGIPRIFSRITSRRSNS
ncbi:hypothetical protein E4U57_003128 [Claviceps arundinis]|uniref:Uncharacterized protein n=1 Tax=Claviceps arundinis TaxID=1623583 RepID=A0ABQ7P7F3_9HYPO|nr:hypothetical protein E4U57_003128 [Claviceps arundinis]